MGAGTPQINHLAELGYAMIGTRGIDLMHHTNVPTKIRYRVYKEAYRTSTMLNGSTVIDIDGNQETWYQHFCSSNPIFATQLWSWGEAVVLKTSIWSTLKITDRGTVCMMVRCKHD